ncbi:hypothetical protein PR048_013794 [Dryococelus australis]|uniref:Uncharacterized protein n=1 Tax=Dryococelus australis TaxID=614101 RepID=A0ABQ9HT75_9NEOP|nr:hypothetical protein PR048_013794 [Dryococelus australis]
MLVHHSGEGSGAIGPLWLLKTKEKEMGCQEVSAGPKLTGFYWGLEDMVEPWPEHSRPTTTIRVRSPVRSLPYYRMWESCWTLPFAAGFLGGARFPALAFQRRSILGSHFMSCPGMTGIYGSQLESPSLGASPWCGAAPELKGRENGKSQGKNPPTSDIFRHDPHVRKFRSDPARDRSRLPSALTAVAKVTGSVNFRWLTEHNITVSASIPTLPTEDQQFDILGSIFTAKQFCVGSYLRQDAKRFRPEKFAGSMTCRLRLYSVMYKYAATNCILVVYCHSGKATVGHRSPGDVKHRAGQWLKSLIMRHQARLHNNLFTRAQVTCTLSAAAVRAHSHVRLAHTELATSVLNKLGLPLAGIFRFQLNVAINKGPNTMLLEEFEDGAIIPIVWAEMVKISLLASHQGISGSIPIRVTGSLHVGIVLDETVCRRVFSRISRIRRPFSPALLLLTFLALMGSQDLAVRSHPNLYTSLHLSRRLVLILLLLTAIVTLLVVSVSTV